jgi:hypothetical protein
MSFDHRPDTLLGAALRDALSLEDHSTFVARVTAETEVPHTVHWDILASWARRGGAAACVAALGASLLVCAMQPAPVDLVASVADPSSRDLMAVDTPPHPGVVLVSEDLF